MVATSNQNSAQKASLLGVKEYDGNTSVVYLDENISAVVAESGNLSFASRVNRWRGVEQKTIEVENSQIKYKANKNSNIKYSLITVLLVLLATA